MEENVKKDLKFLDIEGLKVLWNQISLQDYPNNETLKAVIEAIDETKQDKNLVVTIDEDKRASHTPAEILAYQTNGAKAVFYTGGVESAFLEGNNKVSVFYSSFINSDKIQFTIYQINEDRSISSSRGEYKPPVDESVATKDYVEALYTKLNSNTILGFYCIEDVTIITNGVSKVYPANSNVQVSFIEDDTFEIVPTSNNSILSLTAFPGALGTFYPWLEGVKQFSNILFDMNSEDMYTKWNQGNQGAYQVQYAQYENCIFWSDNPYISELSKRTNYTLYYSSQLPLCYSTIPENTFKSFYLAFGVNSDPNWGNPVYRESFANATWVT